MKFDINDVKVTFFNVIFLTKQAPTGYGSDCLPACLPPCLLCCLLAFLLACPLLSSLFPRNPYGLFRMQLELIFNVLLNNIQTHRHTHDILGSCRSQKLGSYESTYLNYVRVK